MPQGAAQERRHAPDDLFEAQLFRLERLAPSEGEQVTGELCPLLGGLQGHAGEPAVAGIREVVRKDLGVADHHREEVVEVVGDAARELAHRLHLLRLAKLPFRPKPLREIAGDAEDGPVLVRPHR